MQDMMEVIERLDARRDADVRKVLRIVGLGRNYEGPSPFILDPDYDMDQLPLLAEEWGVSLEILSKYRLLVDYIDQTAQQSLDPEFSLAPEQMADDLGIDFAEFEPYFVAEVSRIREALAEDDDVEAASSYSGLPPWETAEDFLEDLQQDALANCD